ncbi:tyrosine-type recombinase/integrase [Oscillospiraceae bacterium PP1C4]
MTGSLRVKKGRYYMVVNYKDEHSKHRQKSIPTGLEEKGNKRKAEQMLRDTLKELEDKQVVFTKEILFSQFINEWMEITKSVVRANTYVAYRCNVDKHIVPYFQKLGVSLQKLQPLQLQKFYAVKMEEGLSASTIIKIHTNIHKCLQYAMVTLNLIPYNPADRVALPKKQKFIGKYFDGEQLQALFQTVKDEPIGPAVVLAGSYGLRRSEVLGLRWDAVDFTKNTISICHAAIEVHNHVTYTDQVKTKSSYRTLPLMKHIKEYLLELKLHQNEMRILCKADYHENDYICKWDDGRPLKPNYITQRFHKILEEHELPSIRFHDLRHSSASMLLSLGFSLKDIQEWLGHADIGTTCNIYAHLQYKQKVHIADKIEGELCRFGNFSGTGKKNEQQDKIHTA